MDKKYNEEMDVLINNFNTELNNILRGRKIEELGFIDLRRLKHEYTALHQLNLDLQDRARKDSEFDTEALRQLLNAGDELYEDNRVSLVDIQNQLNAKMSLATARIDEKREIEFNKARNKEALEGFRKALDAAKRNLNRADSYAQIAYQSVVEQLETSIKQLEDLDNKYDERLKQIEEEMDILKNGGMLPKLEEIQKQTEGITKEEAEVLAAEEVKEEAAVEKTDEEKAKEMLNEVISDDFKKPEEVVVEKTDEEKAKEMLNEVISDDFKKPEETVKTDKEKAEEIIEEIVADDFKKPEVIEEAEVIDNIETDMVSDEIEPEVKARTTIPPVGTPDSSSRIPDLDIPETVYDRGSIADLQEKGVLPKFDEEQILEICSQLGIDTAELGINYIPNQEQLARLANDKYIKLGLANEEIKAKHDKLKQSYEEVGKQYEELKDLDQVKEMANDDALKRRINREARNVEERVDTYTDQIDSIALDDADNFTIEEGSLAQNRIASLDRRSDKINDKIRAQYQKLDELRERKSKQQTKLARQRTEARIQRVQDKINALIEKEGKVSAKQFEIMHAQTDKYVEKKNKDFELIQRRVQAEAELLKVENDLSLTEGTPWYKIGDRIERSQLKSERRALNREIERLSKKAGTTDRRLQTTYPRDMMNIDTMDGPIMIK